MSHEFVNSIIRTCYNSIMYTHWTKYKFENYRLIENDKN